MVDGDPAGGLVGPLPVGTRRNGIEMVVIRGAACGDSVDGRVVLHGRIVGVVWSQPAAQSAEISTDSLGAGAAEQQQSGGEGVG